MQIKKFSAIAPLIALSFLLVGCNATSLDTSAPSSAVSQSASPEVVPPTAAPSTPEKAPEATTAPSVEVPQPAEVGSALQTLETLPVKGAAPKTGYARDLFGSTWADVNDNGCDTRNDILSRDLTNVVKNGNCKVASGTLNDPYTGTVINFVQGPGDLVDIDHVVALSDSWITGSQALSLENRTLLANDPLNLLAVEASANRIKGDKNAASWLPSNKSVRCQYVARQVAVKSKYGLWVQPAEKEAIANVLSGCPAEPLPTGGAIVTDGNPAIEEIDPIVEGVPAAPAAPAPSANGNDPQFSSCAQAKSAGYGPYQKDDAEYGWYRDGDNDGIACE